MLRIAIVEDNKENEREIRAYINRYSKEYSRKIDIQSYCDGDEIVNQYNTELDIIFMDIHMQFMDGITASKKIREMDEDVTIIFVTNMAQYAIHGYEVNALDYVVKPISYFAFAEKLDRAVIRRERRGKKYIAVSAAGILTKLAVSDIRYIESHGHQLTFHLRDKEYVTGNVTMKEVEQRLEKYDFFRCSKSYLVNLEYVESIEQSVACIGTEQIPISRLKKKEFWEVLTNYVGDKVN